MSTYDQLMVLDSANVVSFFETRKDAFATIRDAFERYGVAGSEDLALSEESDEQGGTLFGEGEDLLRLAMAQPRGSFARLRTDD